MCVYIGVSRVNNCPALKEEAKKRKKREKMMNKETQEGSRDLGIVCILCRLFSLSVNKLPAGIMFEKKNYVSIILLLSFAQHTAIGAGSSARAHPREREKISGGFFLDQKEK